MVRLILAETPLTRGLQWEHLIPLATQLFRISSLCALSAFFCASSVAVAAESSNQVSAGERADGWRLLFDGKTFKYWKNPADEKPPGDAWTIDDGTIKAVPHARITEDLISTESYSDFELKWQWKISAGGNSGVKYRIEQLIPLTSDTINRSLKKFEDQVQYATEHMLPDARSRIGEGEKAQVYVVGFEYQLIDNERHRDAKHGPAYQTGALYSIVGPSRAAARAVGEWNDSLLKVRGNHVEHWLNGAKVVDTTLDSELLKANLARRWGKNSAVYHFMVDQPRRSCPISLQNHGDAAWFRNIKVRTQ